MKEYPYTRNLKDYQGFGVIKEVDWEYIPARGRYGEVAYYHLLDEDDNIIHVFRSLAELKHDVDTIWQDKAKKT